MKRLKALSHLGLKSFKSVERATHSFCLGYLCTISRFVLLCTVLACSRQRELSKREGEAEGKPLPLRIVSLSPSSTETLFALGGGELLVGRSRYCNYPKESESLPVVGGYSDPNLEAILRLTPGLVVGENHPMLTSLSRELKARNIATFFSELQSMADVKKMVLDLGDKIGKKEASQKIVREMEHSLSHFDVECTEGKLFHASSQLPNHAKSVKPRVLYLLSSEPPIAVGKDSFLGDMLSHACAENAVNEGGAYPKIGEETLLTLHPDVIVFATMGSAIPKTALWQKIPAMQKGHFISVSDDSLFRPGPRMVEGARALQKAIVTAYKHEPSSETPEP